MDLKPVEYNPEKDPERVAEFSTEMLQKWRKGRDEHGREFRTDPIEEAKSECLDCALYMMVVYFRLKALEERVKNGNIGEDKYSKEMNILVKIVGLKVGMENK